MKPQLLLVHVYSTVYGSVNRNLIAFHSASPLLLQWRRADDLRSGMKEPAVMLVSLLPTKVEYKITAIRDQPRRFFMAAFIAKQAIT